MSFFEFLKKSIGFLLPATCVECGVIGTNLCEKCNTGIVVIENQVCPNCRRKSACGEFCSDACAVEIFNGEKCFLDGVFVCCRYEKNGVIEKLISRFKYKFSDEIKNILCPIMIESFGKFKDMHFDFVIPVPLHSKRERNRGFNQSEILADSISGIRKLNILHRRYNTFPQAKLNRAGRLVNLTNAFELDKSFGNFYGKNFLIIDDVCTTGSTLNECARALQTLRPAKIYGLVLARG